MTDAMQQKYDEIKARNDKIAKNISEMRRRDIDRKVQEFIERTYELCKKNEAEFAEVMKWRSYIYINAELKLEKLRNHDLIMPGFSQLIGSGVLLQLKGEPEKEKLGILDIHRLTEKAWADMITQDAIGFLKWITLNGESLLSASDERVRDLEAQFGLYGEKEGLKTIHERATEHYKMLHPDVQKDLDGYEHILRINRKLREDLKIVLSVYSAWAYALASRYDDIQRQLGSHNDLKIEITKLLQEKEILQREHASAKALADGMKKECEELTRQVSLQTSDAKALNDATLRLRADFDALLKTINRARAMAGQPPLTEAEVRRQAAEGA